MEQNLSNPRIIQQEYGSLARAYARLSGEKTRAEAQEIVRWIHPGRSERVLEAACGPGTLARALAQHVAEVCALDLCPTMIRAGCELCPHATRRVFFTVGDAEQLPYRTASFDLVTCAYSFANFPQPLRALREFARVTCRGGRIAVIDAVAAEDSRRCAALNELECLRSHFFTRVLKQSEFLELFRQAHLVPEARQRQRGIRTLEDWLHLSPAASDPKGAQILQRKFLDAVEGDRAGLRPRQRHGKIVFSYTTARFLMRRP